MDFSQFPISDLLKALGQGMVGAPNIGTGIGRGANLFGQQQDYNQTLDSLLGKPIPTEVSVTPQVTMGANGQINRAPDSAYNQPAMSYNGPAGQSMGPQMASAMGPLLKTMDPSVGLPLLLSTMKPHDVDTVTDGAGQVHRIDKQTGQDLGTIGPQKPTVLSPGQTIGTFDPSKASTPTAPAAPTLQDLSKALLNQESGSNPNIKPSVDGAVGQAQILPSTFKQYAQPGESITNPADNLAVHDRIVADYAQKFGGDAARIATAYFSGPGNVAPAGSPTPWLRDTKDGNGKSVSQYVSDVLNRTQQSVAVPPSSSAFSAAYTAPADQAKAWRPMNSDELTKYNALPGSSINGAGEVQRATATNSEPNYSDSDLKAMAYQQLQNGGKPMMGRDQLTNRQVSKVMNKPVSQGGIRPDSVDEQTWASTITNFGISKHSRQQAAALLAKTQASTAVNEGTVNNSINILSKLIPTAASKGQFTDVNSFMQSLGRRTNDPNAINLKNAIDSISSEYARVMTGATNGAASSDASRHEAAERILLGYNQDALPQVLSQMQAEMRGRSDAQTAGLMALTGGQMGGIPVSNQPGAPKAGAIDTDALLKKYGVH